MPGWPPGRSDSADRPRAVVCRRRAPWATRATRPPVAVIPAARHAGLPRHRSLDLAVASSSVRHLGRVRRRRRGYRPLVRWRAASRAKRVAPGFAGPHPRHPRRPIGQRTGAITHPSARRRPGAGTSDRCSAGSDVVVAVAHHPWRSCLLSACLRVATWAMHAGGVRAAYYALSAGIPRRAHSNLERDRTEKVTIRAGST